MPSVTRRRSFLFQRPPRHPTLTAVPDPMPPLATSSLASGAVHSHSLLCACVCGGLERETCGCGCCGCCGWGRQDGRRARGRMGGTAARGAQPARVVSRGHANVSGARRKRWATSITCRVPRRRSKVSSFRIPQPDRWSIIHRYKYCLLCTYPAWSSTGPIDPFPFVWYDGEVVENDKAVANVKEIVEN